MNRLCSCRVNMSSAFIGSGRGESIPGAGGVNDSGICPVFPAFAYNARLAWALFYKVLNIVEKPIKEALENALTLPCGGNRLGNMPKRQLSEEVQI